MHDMYKELLKKKNKNSKEMDPSEKKAKLGILGEIKKMASDEMGEEVRGLKKVTVAAPDSEGLKEGLDKAEDMVEAKEEDTMDEVMSECETPEEVDAMIAALQKRKMQLQKSEA